MMKGSTSVPSDLNGVNGKDGFGHHQGYHHSQGNMHETIYGDSEKVHGKINVARDNTFLSGRSMRDSS